MIRLGFLIVQLT